MSKPVNIGKKIKDLVTTTFFPETKYLKHFNSKPNNLFKYFKFDSPNFYFE